MGYLRLFPTEAFTFIHVHYDHDDDAKRQPIPTSSNVDDDEVHDKNGGSIQDDDDDDANPKRQLIPTSSQVKSGPIQSLYIQQRPPGGDRALPCFQTKFTLQSVLSFISHVTTGNKHHA